MSRNSTNNSEGIFSNTFNLADLMKEWEINDIVDDRPWRDDIDVAATYPNPHVKSSVFTLGFGEAFNRLGKRVDEFYFYPGELRGFIESCVLATQREHDVVNRDIGLFHDIDAAMKLWQDRVDEAWYHKTGTVRYGGYNLKKREIDKVLVLAGIVDNIVLEKMGVLHDAFGDYALDANEFIWTTGSALTMTVYY